jgi:quercetin dioxygenase-like cupin family protein
MYITRQDDARLEPDPQNPYFVGDVLKQDLVTERDAPSLRVTSVRFQDGARNRWHTHSCEQVLIVTSGRGIVANDEGEHEISHGDVIVIAPGERHWHGAMPGEDMTHLAILLPSDMHLAE